MRVNNRLGNGEAQSRSPGLVWAARLGESFEKVWLKILRNAGSLIGNLKAYGVIAFLGFYQNHAFDRRDIKSIGNKILGLTQITEFWGYYGTYAQEPT